ncbi:MAG: hypothetical protein CMP33_04430 [Rickettsiales bacterium]|nr:hypothetical protein [Rickettsiales bacterium]|tara:strand:- start:19991 stop:20638 length:648 start_codon:yes stop_codon:yes gene_type:complete
MNKTERALIWNTLCNMGDTIKLKWKINEHEVLEQLEQFKDNWCPYNVKKDANNNRWGLPITSHSGDVMDNYHLNSFGYMQKYHDVEMKEENFTTPTEVYNKIPELAKLVDAFSPDIGRVHLLRVDQGGFFPPHRDFPGVGPEWMRLLLVFGKCKPENFVHMLDGKPMYPDPGYLYFVNFQKDHSVFSFSDGLYALILTCKVNDRVHDLIINNSMN